MVKYSGFYYLCDMEKKYFSESHRKYSEACQREVEEMSKHPLTAEEKEAQMDRNKRLSMLRASQRIMKDIEEAKKKTPSFPPRD